MQIVLLSVATVQSLFLGLVLIIYAGRSELKNRIFGILLLLISYDLFEAFSYYYADPLPSVPDYSNPLLFLYGPLIYFYSLSWKGRISLKVVLSIITPSLFIGVLTTIFDLLPLFILGYIHVIFFILLSLKGASFNRELFGLILLFLTLGIIGIALSITESSEILLSILIMFYIILIFRLSYLVMINRKFSLRGNRKEKYSNYRLGRSIDEKNYKKMLNYVNRKKPYLIQDYTQSHLARELEFSENYLSYLLNEVHGENFYKFINGLRVEEAKRLLLEKGLNITEIIYEAGFNSKSTFNKVFKESTGVTPSQFRKKCPTTLKKT